MTDAGTKPGTILVIEDEPAHAELLNIYLSQSTGWVVQNVTSLRQFREVVDTVSPALVLADINLPDGTSLSLLEKNMRWPVVIMTSYADPEIENEAIQSGAAGFFIKSPETFKKISSIVKEYLQAWQQDHK